MMEHLEPKEIEQMPLHMQVLFYLELWGKIEQNNNSNKKLDSAKQLT